MIPAAEATMVPINPEPPLCAGCGAWGCAGGAACVGAGGCAFNHIST